MIRALSETLKKILDDPALAAKFPELAGAQITFDRPTEPFTPGQTTVNLFLYDLRENVNLRDNEPTITRSGGQVTITPPPMRVACSYLVTAWPVGGTELVLQEHRLLSQALQVLSQHPTIPATFLQGSLIGQAPPLPMMTAQTDGLKNPAEFWTALGNKLRPSISVTVTIAMETFKPVTGPMVITEAIRLGERTSPTELQLKPGTRDEFFRIGGRVTNAANAPVKDATVSIVELDLATTTDADGRYNFGPIPPKTPPGPYTLRVESGTTVKSISITIPAPTGSNYNVQLT